MSENIQKELASYKEHVKFLGAHLDAHKQQLSEAVTTALNNRTNVILLNKQNQELTVQLQAANKKCDESSKQLEDAAKRISDLEVQAKSG